MPINNTYDLISAIVFYFIMFLPFVVVGFMAWFRLHYGSFEDFSFGLWFLAFGLSLFLFIPLLWAFLNSSRWA